MRETLEKARALLAAGYVQGAYFGKRREDGTVQEVPMGCAPDCFCSIGAIAQAKQVKPFLLDERSGELKALADAARELLTEEGLMELAASHIGISELLSDGHNWETITFVNDRLGQKGALAMFDRAIQKETSK